jgi:hypothetical protein
VELFEVVTWPLRAILGTPQAGQTQPQPGEAQPGPLGGADLARHHSPFAETRELELRLAETVAVAERSVESLERQILVIGALSEALPPLTAAVTQLTTQLGSLLEVVAPLESAEHGVSRMEHLFGRHPGERPGPGEPPPGP